MSLGQLAAEIERQAAAKKDYIASTPALTMEDDGQLKLRGNGALVVSDHAHGQLAEYAGIPKAYYDRMRANEPALLARNVNTWLHSEAMAKDKRMVRTLDGRVRGIMSNSFRALDNYDLAEAALPALHEAGAQVVSCNVTEARLFIKFLIPGLDRELPIPKGLTMGVGHHFFPRALRGGGSIANSEVGLSGLVINPATLEKQCTNFATYSEEGFRAIHLGRKQSVEDGVREFMSDQTKRLEDAAVWAKFRDMLKAVCDGRVMDKLVSQMLEARGDEIEGNPAEVIEVFGSRKGLTQEERGGLLKYFTQSGEATRYGLQWAVTRLAQDAPSYDRASELERLGGQVIELPRSEWQEVLKAAA
jgi:hypothetical protein